MKKRKSYTSPDSSKLLIIDNLPEPFFCIRENTHKPYFCGEKHSHFFYQIIFTIKANCILETTQEYKINPCNVIIIPPLLPHRWISQDNINFHTFNFNLHHDIEQWSELKQYLDFVTNNHQIIYIVKSEKNQLLKINKIKEEYNNGLLGYKYMAYTEAFSMLFEILRIAVASRTATYKNHQIMNKFDKAIWYLENNYSKNITLKDIGLLLNLDPKYCCYLFKKKFKITPIKLLNNIRLKKAKILLRDPNIKIKEIAFMVGFNDEHYFSKICKKITNKTPKKLREQFFIQYSLK